MTSLDILWQVVILLSQLQLAPFLQVPAHFKRADDEAFRGASLLVHVIICSPPYFNPYSTDGRSGSGDVKSDRDIIPAYGNWEEVRVQAG